MIDKKAGRTLATQDELIVAFNILNYNQGLVQFADSKANALLLINSIFIAALGPFVGRIQAGAGQMPGLQRTVAVVFAISAILSILASLAVFITRRPPGSAYRTTGLIFFGDILRNPHVDAYIEEVRSIDVARFHEQLLANAYDVAAIADRKFSIYNFGQIMTLISCASWLGSMVFCYLF